MAAARRIIDMLRTSDHAGVEAAQGERAASRPDILFLLIIWDIMVRFRYTGRSTR